MSAGDAPSPAKDSQGFFSWVVPAFKTRRTLKTWFRSCVALTATLTLLVVNKSLKNMGQAGFFAAIIAVFLPPSLALSLFLFAAFTLLLGMLVGWAWGAAAMAAGLAVRNQALLAQQQQVLRASLVQGIPQTVQIQRFTFHGGFLDPRTSAVYGAFLFIGTFALGAMRAYIPKVTLLSIFGSVVLDIMCTYGPLFPNSQYTLAKIFLLPTCYYIAIAITTLIFIFPESLNHVWLTTLQTGILKPISQILSTQSQALHSHASDKKKWEALANQSYSERQELLTGAKSLLGQIGMTDLEFSVGRLGPGDLNRLSKELKLLTFKAAGLYAFPIFVSNLHALQVPPEEKIIPTTPTSERRPSTARFSMLHERLHQHEVKNSHDLDSLLPILSTSSAELREACEAAMKGVEKWFHDCNGGRWRGFFLKVDKAGNEKRHDVLVQHLDAVQKALDSFRRVERVKLVEPFERFFDTTTGHQVKSEENTRAFTARSLFICYVFSFSIDAFAERLAKFLTMIVELDGKRPKPRLWAPSGFGKLGRKLMSKDEVDKRAAPLTGSGSSDLTAFDDISLDDGEDEDGVGNIKHARKNPDALPPRTVIGRFFVRLGSVLRWFRSPEAIFSLRHAIVSVALWIPAVCHSTAWLYYSHRGIWALIMAQTALATYAGDQIAFFVLRISGTVLGLLVGMVIWYIGAPGQGHGNPYGIVIATAVLVSPFLLGRIAAPVAQLQIWALGAVTAILVVGYSWIDTHLPVLVNAGVGVDIGWKRALLVIIGFTAAFIVMMFPRPTSGRTFVRHTLAATAGELGHVLAVEIDALLAEETRERVLTLEKEKATVGEDTDQEPSPKELRVRKIAHKVFVLATRLQELRPSLVTARFEPHVQGAWPQKSYEHLFEIQIKLLSALVLFTGAFTQLDTKWCSILVHQTPLLNPNLLSDIFSHISIVAYALAGGHPLPPSLPNLRDRLVYHERLVAHALEKTTNDFSPDPDQGVEFGVDNIGGRMGFDELTLDILKDEQLPAHSTALLALGNAISLVDEMTVVVRDLCGEVKFKGIDVLHDEYLGQEERAMGGGFAPRMRFR